MTELPRVNILGVGINAITMADAVAQIEQWLATHQRHYISVCTVHTVMECQASDTMRQAINQAGMATPDGMPLVWLGRLKTEGPVNRVYGPDLMLHLCELSVQRGWRHYFYGGTPETPSRLAEALQLRFPGLQTVGGYAPPFRPAHAMESPRIITEINQTQADIVWVGLGTPKQDLWMANHRAQLQAPLLVGVGAAFDFLTGQQRQAPAWMQGSGLEWFFRLTQEPRRLWYRYLVYNPLFILSILAQLLKLKKYSL